MSTPEEIEAGVNQALADAIRDEANRLLDQGHTLERVVEAIRSALPRFGEIRAGMLRHALAGQTYAPAEPPASAIDVELAELRERIAKLEERQR